MATQFRQLGPADAEMLAAHFSAWHQREGMALDAAAMNRQAQRVLRDNEAWHTWLIESHGAAVGYLMLQFRKGGMFEAPRAYVAALYVEPVARNLGIGTLARRFVLELGRWLQVRVFDFDTARENKHAQLFLRSAQRSGSATSDSSIQATA